MKNIVFLLLNIVISIGIGATARTGRKGGRMVVSGIPAALPENAFNWMVALYFKGEFICSASIISDRFVLTAAHCVIFDHITAEAKDFVGHAGNVNKASAPLKIEFDSFRAHPNYNSETFAADIAIMVMKQKINFKEKPMVRRICLYREAKEKSRELMAMGWGSTTSPFGTFPEVLHFAYLTIIKNNFCSVIQKTITNATLCARGRYKGLCQGDSGGPLIGFNARGPYLVAVASHVTKRGCRNLNLYKRIAFFKDFILDAEKEFGTSVCFRS